MCEEKKKKKYHCTENQNLDLNTERHRQTRLWIGFLIIRLFGNLKVIILFTGVIFPGTCKVRDEIETKRNETKPNETKRNQTKWNETDRNETKRNPTKRNETKRRYISFRFVSIGFVSFRSVSFRVVWFDFVSCRFYFVSHFTGTLFWQWV